MKINILESNYKYFVSKVGPQDHTIFAVPVDYEIKPEDNFIRWCNDKDIQSLLKDTEINPEDVDMLKANGWEFASKDYVYIPDDEDGCMSTGYNNIRKLLRRYKHKATGIY